MKSKTKFAVAIVAVSLAALVSIALAAQDKYTLKAPNGVASPSFGATNHGRMSQ
jgi:hypothetical protein